MTHWPLRLTGYICCHRHISGNHGKEPTRSAGSICVQLDCDGGASHGAGGGATVVTGATATGATVVGVTVALGGGAVIDLHPVPAAIHIKCCECECCRFTSC